MYQPVKFETRSGLGFQTLLRKGFADLAAGLKRHETWAFLGWHEIKKQYQRSILGPFWLTLNMGILVFALGLFYAQIFGQEVDNFLPYLTLGFVFWGLMSGMINEACGIYTQAAASLRQSQLPLSIYAYKLVWRQFIIFLHNFTIFILVWLIFPLPLTTNVWTVLPALVLILLSGFFTALILGPVAARFRDIPPIVASVTQIFFFLTPIFWTAESLAGRASFLVINPFYHYLAIARQPLMGAEATALNWLVAGSITAIVGVAAIVFFSRFRSQIAYWA